ncbi:MAG: LysR substrate-binding domain-containing protein [Myxococcales bacterium]
MDLNLVSLFVAVAEAKSFSDAARALRVPKSSVSRGIAELERQMGTRLFHRTTRQVALSTAGATLHAQVAPLVAGLRDAVESVPEHEEQPSGLLRISASHDLGATIVAQLMPAFLARYPLVRIEVGVTNRPVNLVGEGYDVALRATSGRLSDSSLTVRRLSAIEMHLFASPTYLARRGTPRSMEETGNHDWAQFGGVPPPKRSAVRNARVLSDDYFFLREALRGGAGIGLLPAFLAVEDVAAGTLVRIVPRFSETRGAWWFVHPGGPHVPAKVSAFRDALIDFLARRPIAPVGA